MIPISYPSPMLTVRRLKQRREAIATLCDALENFLSLDVDAELEMFERMQAAPRTPSVTPEMLVNAQTELEKRRRR